MIVSIVITTQSGHLSILFIYFMKTSGCPKTNSKGQTGLSILNEILQDTHTMSKIASEYITLKAVNKSKIDATFGT